MAQEASTNHLAARVHTPGDIIMAGPRCEAGNTRPRMVSSSRVSNSALMRGRMLVIAFFRERLELEIEDGDDDGCNRSY